MDESSVRFPSPPPLSRRERGDYRVACRDFHANCHDAYRHTPNDEKSAGFRRGRFQTCPGRFRDASGAFSPHGRFETCPYKTALRPYVGEIFHANFHGARASTPDDEKFSCRSGLARDSRASSGANAYSRPRPLLQKTMYFSAFHAKNSPDVCVRAGHARDGRWENFVICAGR